MRTKIINNKHNWILIFFLVLCTEIIDILTALMFPEITMTRYLSIFVLICTLPLLIISLKSIDESDIDLKENKQKLKNIFDTLDVAIWSHDLKSDRLLITPGIEKLYGYTSDDFYNDLNLWKKVIYPADFLVLQERAQKLAIGEAVTSEYRIIRPDGEVRWIRDRGFPTLDEKGNFVDFNSVLFDITDRKESEDLYRSLVEMSPDIIAVVSHKKIEYMNEAGWKLLGASGPDEITGKSVIDFVPVEIVKTIQKEIGRLGHRDQEKLRIEFQVKKLDGQTIDVEMASTPILFEGKFAVQIVGRDTTKRKEAERTIQHMAYFDSLTGLPNRNRFRQKLNEVLLSQKDQMAAVLFLDLDRFKIINDTKGHIVGDLILQKAARRLETSVQYAGLVSRLGGDEFIILLENTDKEQVTKVATKILEDFSAPFEVNEQEFFVTPSIGISIYPTDGLDEETLIKQADTAMYEAKGRGTNNFCFYSASLNGISIRKMEIDNGLRSEEQVQFLKEHTCGSGQGYFYSQPLPSDQNHNGIPV